MIEEEGLGALGVAQRDVREKSFIREYHCPMSSLTKKHCLPCEGGAKPLTKEQATELLKQILGWGISQDGKKISRSFKFKNFRETSAFFNQVAEIAESENHHPDFEVHYGSMTITLWTHAIGGLSENDFIVAAKVNAIGD